MNNELERRDGRLWRPGILGEFAYTTKFRHNGQLRDILPK